MSCIISPCAQNFKFPTIKTRRFFADTLIRSCFPGAQELSKPCKKYATICISCRFCKLKLDKTETQCYIHFNKIHGRGAMIISTLFDMAGIYDNRRKDDLPKNARPCSFAIWLHG